MTHHAAADFVNGRALPDFVARAPRPWDYRPRFLREKPSRTASLCISKVDFTSEMPETHGRGARATKNGHTPMKRSKNLLPTHFGPRMIRANDRLAHPRHPGIDAV